MSEFWVRHGCWVGSRRLISNLRIAVADLVVVFIEAGSGCLLGRTAFEFEVRLRWAIWFCKVLPWVMNEEMGVRGWVRLGLG